MMRPGLEVVVGDSGRWWQWQCGSGGCWFGLVISFYFAELGCGG